MSHLKKYAKGAMGKQERQQDELKAEVTTWVFSCILIAASAIYRKDSIVKEILETIGMWMEQGKRTRDYSLGLTRNYGDAPANSMVEPQPGAASALRGKPPHPRAYIQMAFTNAIAREVIYLERCRERNRQLEAGGAEIVPGE